MDAGTAAVLGALAGSVATIGAALATGWAQREGARIGARSEHRRARREPRQETYKEFISAALAFRTEIVRFTHVDFMPDQIDEATTDRLYEAAQAIKERALDVALAGPRRVSKEALKIERVSGHLSSVISFLKYVMENDGYADTDADRRLLHGTRKDIARDARKIDFSVDRLVLRAQGALDDDGST
ncbi:hypothetical protein [Streptomyces mirabilis]|uniref:hypothetical protein n=1 Tax=Streptomyces mirabilis TaxID=68239 RepID=UPI0036BAAFEF